MSTADPLAHDWLAVCREGLGAVREAIKGQGDRHEQTGDRGEGGDMTLVIDSHAEEAILAAIDGAGIPCSVVSEECGKVALSGGGDLTVVIDPIDGSLNAKRGIPLAGVSIAVADGEDMAAVRFGYVAELHEGGFEWWARAGEGAWEDGRALLSTDVDRIEVLGLESADPKLVAPAAERLKDSEIHRLRILGSIALSLCYVAAGRFDGMSTLWGARSVDAAAAQLIVREAGAEVAFVDAGDGELGASLGLDMRSRVMAGAGPAALAAVRDLLG